MKYAKALVAAIGAAGEAAVAIWGAHSPAGQLAEVVVAAITAAGVYLVPNATDPAVSPAPGRPS